jgi:phosphopantetheinyl transferase
MTSDIPHGRWGIWQVEEELSFFLEQLTLHPLEIMETNTLQGRKLKEWYASRWLLHQLLSPSVKCVCVKDSNGKPLILDSDIHLSISHSDDYAAVITSDRSVGIDVQKILDKISRIAPKFVEPEAWHYLPESDSLLYLHAIWGAKESMYKAYGLRGLDFRKDMKILPFQFDPEGFYFEGIVHKGDYYRKFNLFCRQINQFILVYAIEVI